MTRAWLAAVQLDPRARRCWPHLPAKEPPGSIWQAASGELVRVTDDGCATEILPGGHPRSGAASDPAARRAP